MNYVVPWVLDKVSLNGISVLEIGCGEGGNLPPFEAKGSTVTGVDRNPRRIAQARHFIESDNSLSSIQLVVAEALDLNKQSIGKFDLIILKDFIEHIDREAFLPVLKDLIEPNVKVFIAFPPWLMPYGGHQQICNNKLARFPWLHLLPLTSYGKALRWLGESDEVIKSLTEVYTEGVNIEALYTDLINHGFQIDQQ